MLSHHSQMAGQLAVKLGRYMDPRVVIVLSGILQLPRSRRVMIGSKYIYKMRIQGSLIISRAAPGSLALFKPNLT